MSPRAQFANTSDGGSATDLPSPAPYKTTAMTFLLTSGKDLRVVAARMTTIPPWEYPTRANFVPGHALVCDSMRLTMSFGPIAECAAISAAVGACAFGAAAFGASAFGAPALGNRFVNPKPSAGYWTG